jgi:amino acid adenylation domain-containing protein
MEKSRMMKNVTEYLEATAARLPDKLAFADAKTSLTFAELRARARSVGTFLARRGLFKKPVVVVMERGANCVPAFLGAAYSGNFYVPLDVEMPPERIAKILEKLRPAWFITERNARGALIEAGADADRISLYDDIMSIAVDDELLRKADERQIDADLLYVPFTSGSTGVPKGVAVTHRGMIDYTETLTETFGFDESTVFGHAVPFTFDGSILHIYNVLRNGCTDRIIPKACLSFAAKMVDFLNEKQVTHIYWVPTSYNIVAKSGIFDKRSPQTLKWCGFVGEVMPSAVLNVWRRAVPNACYANIFGPTETTGTCMFYKIDREFADDEPLPIGKPYRNADVLLLTEDGREAERGEVGEMCVRASKIGFGYYNDPERTAAAFTRNPLNTAYPETIYRTGDLAYRNERGELMFKGRRDFQIKHAGHRIELGEIEAAAGTVGGVETCGCVYDGERQKIVLFYSGAAEPGTVTDALKSKLQSYMLPGIVTKLDALPRTPAGKIDRTALKAGLGTV